METAQSSQVRSFNAASRAWLRTAHWGHPYALLIRRLSDGIERGGRALRLAPNARLLDFGCAEKPYRGLFPADLQYVGADLPGNPDADVPVSEAGTLPLADESFDAVISTQVLEHVADPPAYLRECYRVLAPGGRLLLTTHGTMILHPDPIDLWRWTSAGLKFEVERAGLRVVEFEGLMGLTAIALQLFQDGTLGYLPERLRKPYAFLIQSLATFCDRRHTAQSRAYNAFVYVVVAEKPGRDGSVTDAQTNGDGEPDGDDRGLHAG